MLLGNKWNIRVGELLGWAGRSGGDQSPIANCGVAANHRTVTALPGQLLRRRQRLGLDRCSV